MEQSGKWPRQACTTRFFLIPKNVTSERPTALVPTLTRWWEALRAPDVAKWQQKYRVEWDVTDGRNGRAQRTVWEVLMEMERFNGRAKAEDQGAVAFVLDLSKAFERVSLPCALGCAVISSTRGACSSKGVRQSRSQSSLLSSQGPSGVVCLYVLYCKMR